MDGTQGFSKSTWGRLALAALVLGLAAYVAWQFSASPPPAAQRVVIAVPTQINNAVVIVASGQNLFQKAGVEVVMQPFLLGKDALKSVIDGNADLAVVADVPFLFARHGGHDIAILANLSRARRSFALVARADRGIVALSDLKGKSVALTKGTNSTYFFDALLQVHGVPSEGVRVLDMNLVQAQEALQAGQVDAMVNIQPFLAATLAQMGERARVFYGEEVYAFRFLLVGKRSYIDSHPLEMQRVLSALNAARQSIAADSVTARKRVGDVVKIDDATMATLFDPRDFVLELDQALLLALDDQTRWAMKEGLIKAGPVPNYLDAIKHSPLQAVNPNAVTFVH